MWTSLAVRRFCNTRGLLVAVTLAVGDSTRGAENGVSLVREIGQDRSNMTRHTDLQEMALRGKVRQLVTRVVRAGSVSTEGSIDFDVAGRRIQPALMGVTTSVANDGSQTETLSLAGVPSGAWANRFVRDIGFGFDAGAVIRTVIEESGAPRQTVFEDSLGQLVARIDYVLDQNGRVSSAVHRHVFFGRAGRPVSPAQGALLMELPESVRVDLTYTSEGDVKSVTAYIAGTRRWHEEYTYVDRRLVAVLRVDGPSGEERIDKYEYLSTDETGNWTSRTITSRNGTRTEVREITYYP